MSKPIDLIVANIMHDCADSAPIAETFIEATVAAAAAKPDNRSTPVTKESMTRQWHEACARTLLCKIAHDGRIQDVFKALASLNAPATPEMIAEGLQAVKDLG